MMENLIENFPNDFRNGLELILFLKASKGMVLLVDDLGRLFSPLSYDMNNNIHKIEQGCEKLGKKCLTVEDLLLAEHQNNGNLISEALVWLTRSLRFLRIFLRCVGDDLSCKENLEFAMIMAYQGSLEPYHGWVTRKLFSFFCKVCPSRATTLTILEKRFGNERVIDQVLLFSNRLGLTLDHIDSFLRNNGIRCDFSVI